MPSVSPSQTDIETVLRSFLLNAIPLNVSAPQTAIEVVLGQDNRVPEPASPDFIVMTTVSRERLETNLDVFQDVAFIGSISGLVLTVSTVQIGTIIPATLFGSGVLPNTTIGTQISGIPGGAGTYNVSPTQNLASTQMSSGAATYTQHTEVTVQLDVHGPNSSDNAEVITTMFRDQFAFDYFISQNPNVFPLHADDPKQIPFIDAESQYEWRWIVEAHIQANQTIVLPQQFANKVQVTLQEVP